MKQILITSAIAVAALIIGLSAGKLTEVNQTLLLAGAIVAVVYGAAAAVFAVALYGTFKLWRIVLDALHWGKSEQAKALLQLIGGFDLEGSIEQVGVKRKLRVAGTGMLGTLVIMGFACVAIYIMFSIVPKDADIVNVGGKPVLSEPRKR
jgi:hypothetical protein